MKDAKIIIKKKTELFQGQTVQRYYGVGVEYVDEKSDQFNQDVVAACHALIN
jgi:hypothetical protein